MFDPSKTGCPISDCNHNLQGICHYSGPCTYDFDENDTESEDIENEQLELESTTVDRST